MNQKLGWFLGAVVVFFCIVFALTGPMMIDAWRQKQAAEVAFDKFAGSLQKQEFEAAYSATNSNFRNAMNYEQFVELQRKIQQKHGELKSLKRTNATVNGKGEPMEWEAFINAEANYTGAKIELIFEFRLEGDSWKLNGYKEVI